MNPKTVMFGQTGEPRQQRRRDRVDMGKGQLVPRIVEYDLLRRGHGGGMASPA